MSITTICPNPDCGKEFRLEDGAVGRSARCKKCSTRFRVKDGVGELLSKQSSSGSAAPEQSPVAAVQRTAENDGAAADWNVGDKILDLYEVTGILGEGGMGKVYKVRHNGWNVDLAVKSPRAEILTKKHAIENFETEAETWVNLGMHPHTVSCYYVRRLGGIPRVFAEYVAGGNLKEWIESGKLYDGGHDEALKRILGIAIQFAWGLHYAHQQGLIHQDVKPTNLMMTLGGTAKVTDFGLAKARAAAGEVTATKGQSILVSSGGMTPAYCSPEQANSEKLTRKTDIWSWAVSVLEMFTGDVTWPSGTVAGEALESLLEMGSGDEAIPAMPASLAELLRKCFQKDASQRPKDMQLIADRLQEIFERSTGTQFERSEPKAAQMMADGLNNRGVSLLDLGRTDDAEKALDDALRQDPHHPEAVYNLGLLRWQDARGTDTDLLTQLKELGNARPDDWKVAYLEGLVHLQRLDAESAVEKLEEARLSHSATEVESALASARRLLPDVETDVRTFEGNEGRVNSVCFSPDGRTCLSGSGPYASEPRLWEVSSGRCLRTFEGHSTGVASVAFSPDGCTCLSGSFDKTLRLWEVSSGQCLRTFEGHSEWVTSVAFSPDGRTCLSGGWDDTLRLWEVSLYLENHAHVGTILAQPSDVAEATECDRQFAELLEKVDQHHAKGDESAALERLRDARKLSGKEFVPEVLNWNHVIGRHCRTQRLRSGWLKRTFEGHKEIVTSVSFSPDGRTCLSGSVDKTLRLWEVSSGECLRTFEGHEEDIESVCFSSDGRTCLSGSRDKTHRLWEVSSGRCLRTFEGHSSHVTSVSFSSEWVISVAFSPDGRTCLSGSSDKTLCVWEVSSGRCLRTFEGHSNGVNSVAFSPDGRTCLSGSHDGTLRVWEFDWEYEFPGWADWDEAAERYLSNFLTLHTPYAGTLSNESESTDEEVLAALTRAGKPKWSDQDFDKLITDLQHAGYGWLRPEGVRKKLEEMAADWNGPPPLPSQDTSE